MTPREIRRLKEETSRGISRFGVARFGKEVPSAGDSGSNLDPGLTFAVDFSQSTTPSSGPPAPWTYTRATTATVKDFEGLIKSCLSGELRVQGARRVQNWLTNSTDSSTWSTATSGTGTATKTDNYGTAPDGTLTAARLVATKGSGYGVVRIPKTGNLPGTAIQQTCWIKSNTAGSQNVELGNVSVAYATVTVTPTWKRLTPGVQTVSAGGASLLEIGAGGSGADASIDILIWHPQMEDVTGQSNQNPSEYVSVGVESTPYHGYFVDGVKYFGYQNGNTVASNVVTEAQGSAISTTIGYLAEGARTNLCLQSNTFNNASWTSTLGTLTQNTTGPDGAVSAWTATDNSAVAFLSVSQLLTIVNTTTYAHSIFVQKTSGATVFPVFEVGQGDGINYFGAVINTNTGVITAVTGGAYVAPTSVSAHSIGDFWRVIIVGTSNGVTCRFSFYPAASSNGTTVGAVSLTGSAVIYGAQLEAAAFASTYIPTTTAAVARNADALTVPTAGLFSNGAGSVFAEFMYLGTAAIGSSRTVLESNGAGGGGIMLYNSGTDKNLQNYDGTNLVSKTLDTTMLNRMVKAASSWGSSGLLVTGDGLAPASASFDGTMSIGASMSIGNATQSANPLWGVIKTVRTYNRQLSATQLQALTS